MLSSKLPRQLGVITARASSRYSSTVARSSAPALLSTSCNRPQPTLKHAPPTASTAQRNFSSMGMMPTRAFPQYTVFGPDSALSIRSILPTFKRAGNDGVSVERRGKLVLEFIPRNQTGAGFMWQEKTVFSLSVEEVGLFVSQLPGSGVELSHAAHNASYDRDDANSGVTQLSGDVVEKVLTIEQGEGSAVLFKVDYMKDGVGGQSPPGQESFPSTPLEVTVQAGEFEVIKTICQNSIPYLLGWNTTMDIASAHAISIGVMGRNGGHQY